MSFTLKFFRMIFLAAILSTAVASAINGRETAQEHATEQLPLVNGVADCATIEAVGSPSAGETVSLRGHVTFLGPIRCDVPTIWMVEADTVIESVTTIDTFDVVFLVYPGVRLVFRAPAVSLKRGPELQDEEEEIVLNVGGQIEFEVSGPYPSYVSGSTVDKYGLVILEAGGDMLSNQPPHFTDNEIVVADPTGSSAIATSSTPNVGDDISSRNHKNGNDSAVTTTDGGVSAGSPQNSTALNRKEEPLPFDVPPLPAPCPGSTTADESHIPHAHSLVTTTDGSTSAGLPEETGTGTGTAGTMDVDPLPTDAPPSATSGPGSTTSDEPDIPHASSGSRSSPASTLTSGTSEGEERVPTRNTWTRVKTKPSTDSGKRSPPGQTQTPGTCEGEERARTRNAWTHVKTKRGADSGKPSYSAPSPTSGTPEAVKRESFRNVWTHVKTKRSADRGKPSSSAPTPTPGAAEQEERAPYHSAWTEGRVKPTNGRMPRTPTRPLRRTVERTVQRAPPLQAGDILKGKLRKGQDRRSSARASHVDVVTLLAQIVGEPPRADGPA